jgi:hypothetical protein
MQASGFSVRSAKDHPMLDFRDAKAMAQTLREALNTKSVLITHTESLELVAKILGFQDWNVLPARIQSDVPSRVGLDHTNKAERQEIHLDVAILDHYVGFYRLSDRAVMTISRDGGQLLSCLTGQRNVSLYGESITKFFAKNVDVQISFIADKSKKAQVLILHQHGHDVSMRRIDVAEAKQIEELITEKVNNQSPSPETEPALRRLIDGIRTGKPNYKEMTPPLADLTRKQLSHLHADIGEAGSIQSIRFVGVGSGGADVYCVQHERRTLHWRINLDEDGMIFMALVTPGL